MKPFRRIFSLLLAFPFVFPTVALASGEGLDLSADMAANGFAVRREVFGQEEWNYPQMGRLRLNAGTGEGEILSFRTSYELNAVRPDGFDFLSARVKSPLRLDDIEPYIRRGDTVVTQNLDRLFAQYMSGPASASAGRQAIGHGSGRLFNPSDIFAPLAVQTSYTEYKRGIDAFRAGYEFAEEFTPGVLLVAHEDGFRESCYLLTAQGRLGGGNYSLYGGSTLGAGTLGFDGATDLGGAGIYAEGVFRTDRAFAESLRATAGAHTKLSENATAIIELLYSGVGEKKAENYLLTTRTKEWRNAEISFLGRWYGGFDLSWEATPLVTLSLMVIENLGDGSALFSPKIAWSAAEWSFGTLSVSLGASVGTPGREAASEFGSYPDIYFAEAVMNL